MNIRLLERFGGWMESHPRHALAFAILLLIAFQGTWIAAHTPTVESSETGHWWPIVLNVAHGNGYVGCFPEYFPFCTETNQQTAQREPLPVLFFALTARMSGDSLVATTIAQLVFTIAILIALVALARRIAGEVVAFIAALLWATYIPAAIVTPQVCGEHLAALFITTGALLFLRAKDELKVQYWLGAGALFGAASLSRSVALPIGLMLAASLIPWRRLRAVNAPAAQARSWRPVFLFGTALVVVITPWLVYTTLSLGRPVVGTTLTGYNLYREHYMLGQENYLRFVAGPEGERAISSLIASTNTLTGNENEAEMDVFYRSAAIDTIKAHPLRYVHLSAYRFLVLWFDWRVAESYGRPLNKSDYIAMLEQAGLLIFGGFGLVRMKRKQWWIAASIGMLIVSQMALISRLRFLLPVVPLVLLVSAIGFVSTWRRTDVVPGS